MERALDDTGLHISLQTLVVPTHVTIEDLMIHNVSKTVENHHRHCKY